MISLNDIFSIIWNILAVYGIFYIVLGDSMMRDESFGKRFGVFASITLAFIVFVAVTKL